MGAYAPAGFCNKKAPKPLFQALVQTFLCTCILLLWESQKRRLEPNILTWCVGQKPRPFRKAFPAPASGCAAALSEKTYTLQCRSASGIHTPFLCTSRCNAKPCSCMPIFICKLIMNLFVRFVNIFTQKNSKNSKNVSAPPGAHFKHCFLPACSRCRGKMRSLSTK